MAYWLGILVMAVMASCQKDNVMTDVEENLHNEKASLNMVFRATAPGPDEGMQQQTGMENLMVLLVDQKNTIVKGKIIDNIPEQESKLQTIIFDGLELGVYNLYAYANQPGLTFKENGTFDDTSKNQAFAVLTGTAVPDINGNQKLLTATKEVSIKVGENHTRLELKRTVAKMNMKIYNHSTSDIYITDLTFGNFNSSTSYLFSHNGILPPANKYRALPPYNLTGQDQKILANGSREVYTTFLYENKADGQYYFNMGLSVGPPKSDNWVLTPASIKDKKAVYTISNGNYYMVDNNGTLGVIKNTAIKNIQNTNQNFYWIIKEVSEEVVTIQNALTKNYVQMTQSPTGGNFVTGYTYEYNLSTIKSSFTFSTKTNKSDTGFYVSYKETGRFGTTHDATRYINITNNSITTASKEKFNQIKTPHNESGGIYISNQQIKTVDRQTAHVAPLTQILRNQNVGIVLNIYYNDKTDDFNFQVEPWDKKDEEVEFN